jgi:hypothetical protein
MLAKELANQAEEHARSPIRRALQDEIGSTARGSVTARSRRAMIKAMDPYAVLGVSRSATREEVEAAYRRRLRIHDPDKQTSDDDRAAAIRFRSEVQQAYEAIGRADAFGGDPALPEALPPRVFPPPLDGAPAGPLPPIEPLGAPRAPRRDPKPTKPPLGAGERIGIVVGALAVFALIRVPLQYGFGVVPAVVCYLLAIALLVAGWSFLHDHI